jgi:hypothetical protein
MSASETPAPGGVTALKRVSAYRTSDGAIHETRTAAELAEAEIALDALVEALSFGHEEAPLTAFVHDNADALGAALSRLLKAQKKARAA